eukprot:14133996-Alexandrium_andersonii.AAC.2
MRSEPIGIHSWAFIMALTAGAVEQSADLAGATLPPEACRYDKAYEPPLMSLAQCLGPRAEIVTSSASVRGIHER